MTPRLEVYNKANTEQAQTELGKIPSLIDSQQLIINENAPKIKILEEKLAPIEAEIDRRANIIHNMEKQYEALSYKIKAIEKQLAELKLQYPAGSNDKPIRQTEKELMDKREEYKTLFNNIETRTSDLRAYKDKYLTPLHDKLSPLWRAVEDAKTEIKRLNKKRESLNLYIESAINFLTQLQQNPENMFNSLLKKTKIQLNAYDKSHTNQPVLVRLSLYKLEEKLEAIKKHITTSATTPVFEPLYQDFLRDLQPLKPANTNNPAEWHKKYLVLIGFLWDMHHNVTEINEFKACIFSLLCDGHIDDRSDLPDEMKTGTNCDIQFKQVKDIETNKALFNTTEEQLLTEETTNYIDAYDKFLAFANTGKEKLHLHALELAKVIKAEATRKRNHTPNIMTGASTEQPFNKKTYTEILTLSHKFATNSPLSEMDIDRYVYLAENVPGTPSLAKKIGGIMIAILGAVLIGLSISLAIASFGGSSIFSAIGIAIGTTLIAQSLAVTACVASTGVVAGGCGMFAHGRRKGISKSMHNFLEEAELPRPAKAA